MLSHWLKKLWATALLAVTPAIAFAQNAEQDTQNWFYASTQSDRAAPLAALKSSAASDNTARFGLGSVQFFSAIEGFAQDMVKYGLASHERDLRQFMPLPLAPNPAPAKLTYADLRQALVDFETELELARATLSGVDADQPVNITISFDQSRFNATGQETIPDELRFMDVIAAAQSPAGRPASGTENQPELTFTFDNADAIWLEGYTNVILSQVDFLLAHDFNRAFDASFHLFFPKSDLPLQDALIPNGYNSGSGMFGPEGMIADAISLIHLLDWPVVEPERRADFARHMSEVARLSAANWEAIKQEIDNNKEWLPGPQQPGVHPLTGIEVSDQMVDGWLKSMQLLDDIMKGERLVPHWRFEDRGLNLKRYFNSTQNFDPVLLMTGPGALPYLEQGDIVTQAEWREIQNLVGRRNFGMVAAWFN